MRSQSSNSDLSQIPVEVTRWNWGAFLLTWIWGIRFGVWLSLLMFIPFFNIIWWFVLGAKGGEWAWKKNNWTSVEEFKKSQRKWAIAGLIIVILSVVIGVGVGLLQPHR